MRSSPSNTENNDALIKASSLEIDSDLLIATWNGNPELFNQLAIKLIEDDNREMLLFLLKRKDFNFWLYMTASRHLLTVLIQKGSLSLIKWLADQDYSITAIGEQNAVFWAIAYNRLDILQWLVEEKNCSLNIKSDQGEPSLIFAIKRGSLETLKWLVERKGCSLEGRLNGQTVVHIAVINRQLEVLKWLVDEKQCSLSDKTDGGSTVVLLASSLAILKWLVEEKHCSLDDVDDEQEGVLYSVIPWHPEIMEWLVEEKKYSFNEVLRVALAKQAFFFDDDELLETLKWLVLKTEWQKDCQIEELPQAVKRVTEKLDVQERITFLKQFYEPKILDCYLNKDANGVAFFAEHYQAERGVDAFQYQVEMLLSQNEPIENISQFYIDNIDNKNQACRDHARFGLVDYLIQGEDILFEEGSPLESVTDSALSENNFALKRYLQAWELLVPCKGEEAEHFRKLIHQGLQNKRLLSSQTEEKIDPSQWTPKALEYLALYKHYKSDPQDVIVKAILNSHSSTNNHASSSHTLFSSSEKKSQNSTTLPEPKFSSYAQSMLNQYHFDVTVHSNTTLIISLNGEGYKKSLQRAIYGELAGHISHAMRKNTSEINNSINETLKITVDSKETRDILLNLLAKYNFKILPTKNLIHTSS